MCEAIRQIRAKGIEEGRKEGIEEGKVEGRKEGRKEGKEEGIAQNKHDVAVNALHMKLSFKTIQKLTGLPLESISSIANSIAML